MSVNVYWHLVYSFHSLGCAKVVCENYMFFFCNKILFASYYHKKFALSFSDKYKVTHEYCGSGSSGQQSITINKGSINHVCEIIAWLSLS